MMKLLKKPNPWLKRKVASFNFDLLDPLIISELMIKVMRENNGIGLSANQVGLDAQIFVMDLLESYSSRNLTVINPEIIYKSKEVIEDYEGCLSSPYLWLKIKRPKRITVKFLDETKKETEITLSNINARCFLHEYDHLQGIDYSSYVSKLQLDIARRKSKKVR